MKVRVYDSIKGESSTFAVTELSYYLEQLIDAEVEVVQSINEADIVLKMNLENISNKDRIKVQFKDGRGEIDSNSATALLIGVYRFVSELGVVFTRPGRQFEYIPKDATSTWKTKQIDVVEEASFAHRGVCIEGADSYENIADFIDWLPKIGMNTFFVQFENPYSFLKRWYEHEFNPYANKEPFNNEIAQEMSDRLDLEINKRGLSHHRVGHGWTGEVLGYSSKYGWESGLTLPKEKEAFAAELNGKRELYNTAPILTSLCFSNPEVGAKMVELIVDYAREHRDIDYLHVWLSDARNNICECSNCQKDIPADQYIRILNDLDRALTEAELETKICFLLYHELLFAPQKERLLNQERFTMMFAPITRTFEMSYADVDYDNNIPTPAEYVRNEMVLPNSLEANLSYLFQWQGSFKGDSFVYDYPLGRAHYGDLGYMKISKVIHRDIAFLENLGLNGYISCQELRAGFPHNFPNYVMGRMLWNNTLSYDDLKETYFTALYGAGWQAVVSYLEKLSEYSSCDYFNAIGDRQDADLSVKYEISSQLAFNFVDVLEEHITLHEGVQREAWRQLSYHREYVVKLAYALHLMTSGNHMKGQMYWRDVLDYIRNHESDFQPHLDVYRVIEVAKNYAGFKL